MVKRNSFSIENSIILVVDDNRVNLEIAKSALPKTYEVFALPSAERMFNLITKKKPDLILLDIDMPEMDGFSAIKVLKANTQTCDVPVIFLSGRNDSPSIKTAIDLGAIDFIAKPILPRLLLKSVELHLAVFWQRKQLQRQQNLLEQNLAELEAFENNFQAVVDRKSNSVRQIQDAVLDTVSKLVEFRRDSSCTESSSPSPIHHHSGLAIMIKALKERNLYSEQIKNWDLDLLIQSAKLHDVGKLAITGDLLAKPGKLTSSEYEQVKKHPLFGVQIINQMEGMAFDHVLLKYAKVFAKTHQEKWDGTGYPDGLVGEDIPLPGRLMAINDVYRALTTQRPYKKAMSHDDAVKVIIDGKGTHFDPVLVHVFSEVADEFRMAANA